MQIFEKKYYIFVDLEISIILKKKLFEMVIKIKSYDQNGEKHFL